MYIYIYDICSSLSVSQNSLERATSVSIHNVQFIFVLLTKRYSGDQVTKDEMGGACGTYGEMRKTHRAVVNKTDVKDLLVRPRRRWEDNSEIVLMVRTGLMSLRTERNFKLHKRMGVVFLAG